MPIARLIIASGKDSDMRYATGLDISDPFIWVRLGEGAKRKEFVIVSKLEYGRAKKESRSGVKVVLLESIDTGGLRVTGRPKGLADSAAAFLRSYAVGEVAVPPQLWAVHLDRVREHGIRARIEQPFFPERRTKTQSEIAAIKRVGLVAKKALRHAIDLIRAATIDWDDRLILDDKPLTSERVREEIERVFLANGCASNETIVSCGEQAAMPHHRGTGPLYAGVPIILDLFPRDTRTGYHFDMTRVVVKGTPGKEAVKLIGAVKRAHAEALAVVAPGKASGVHAAATEVFTRLGYKTTDEEGFIHSVGHGLGLDIHEGPRVSEKSPDVLQAGDVITVEPGLYYKDIGGARIEDTVLVTKSGCVNLTNLPKAFFLK